MFGFIDEVSMASGPFSEWFPEEDVVVPVDEWLDRELKVSVTW